MRARNLFTDVDAAIEEADFLSVRHKRKFIVVQLMLGEVWVRQAGNYKGSGIMYQTSNTEEELSNDWEFAPELTLARHHLDSLRPEVKSELQQAEALKIWRAGNG